MMAPRRALAATMTILAAVALLAVVLSGAGAQEAMPVATPAPVVREVLARGIPDNAGGDALELVRYIIPPHTTLPAHTHPGMQTAWIETGTLYYTVLQGAVPHYRGGDLDQPPTAITPDSGEIAIEAGDAIVEPEGVTHFGRTGDAEVVILVASLFDPGQPPAILATPAP